MAEKRITLEGPPNRKLRVIRGAEGSHPLQIVRQRIHMLQTVHPIWGRRSDRRRPCISSGVTETAPARPGTNKHLSQRPRKAKELGGNNISDVAEAMKGMGDQLHGNRVKEDVLHLQSSTSH